MRVLCDPSVLARAGSSCSRVERDRSRAVVAAVVRGRRRRARVLGAGHRVRPRPTSGATGDRDAERRHRPRRRRGGDAARRVGVPRPRLLRRRDGRPRARASARARARRRRARPKRARERHGAHEAAGRAPPRLRRPARRHRVRAHRSCARERARARSGWTSSAHDPFVLGLGDRRRRRSTRSRSTSSCASSTAVSVHVPLTEETRGLIGARELALLPRRRLRRQRLARRARRHSTRCSQASSGRLGGVALDVLEVEPPTAASPAPAAPRLIVNPHAGWYSERADEARQPPRGRIGARRARGADASQRGERGRQPFSLTPGASVGRHMSDRPHILVVMVDQLSALFLRAYGHRVTKTPTIDRLAEEGVVFENAYSPSPLCAPARAVFMTGSLPSRTGVYDNSAEFRSSIPTFAHYLRLEGYRTCLSGKMHFVGADQLHGFEERLTTDVYPGDFGWTPTGAGPASASTGGTTTCRSVKQAGVAEMTNQLEYDDEVAFHAVRRLYDYARYEGDVPLLALRLVHPSPRSVRRAAAVLGSLLGRRDRPAGGPAACPRRARSAQPPPLAATAPMGEFEITEDDVRACTARVLREPRVRRREDRRGAAALEALRARGRHGRALLAPTTASSWASTGSSTRCPSASIPRASRSSFTPPRASRLGASASRCPSST